MSTQRPIARAHRRRQALGAEGGRPALDPCHQVHPACRESAPVFGGGAASD
jgi:hypothetical protein